MKGDLPEVALRLSSTLPSRIHTHHGRAYIQGSKSGIPLLVDGQKFKSIYSVRRHFHISSETLDKWIRNGKARYI